MAIKLVEVDDLEPGGVLGEAVIAASGKVLINKGSVITEKILARLVAWDIKSVSVVAAELAEVEVPQDPIEDNFEAPEEYHRFAQEYDVVVKAITQSFDFIRRQKLIPVHLFKDTSKQIASSIEECESALINRLLVNECQLADAITRHSVMVAYLAGSFASHMKWNDDDIHGVILSGLLHDAGKIVLDKADAGKPYKHIVEAATLLSKIKGLTGDVVLGVVQHHEYIDGSGIPTKAKGDKIHRYAKLIAVADIFQSEAYIRKLANPFPALNILEHEMFGRLDPAICQDFIQQIKNCLLNTKVLLSDGRTAEVIYFHPNGSALPVVKTADGQIVDTSAGGKIILERLVPMEGLANSNDVIMAVS
ncbi:MAG: hypothetical protein H6Q74_1616 [Firmicutes bacterium]|nr:hypothetical protein [Bacillota bacterium]